MAASLNGHLELVKTLRASLGPSDRARIDRYLTDVNELERRIKMIEARNSSGDTRELPDAPAGVPDSFSEHMKLMFDLQVLALQTDMTRVIAFKTGWMRRPTARRWSPLVLFGHANGLLKGGVHMKADDDTPMANVMLTLMHRLGLDDVKTFGDSTGEFSLA